VRKGLSHPRGFGGSVLDVLIAGVLIVVLLGLVAGDIALVRALRRRRR
jgi:hypothetical protein